MNFLSRNQLREIDRRCIDDYGLPGIVLMENAARGASEIAMNVLGGKRRVAIVCGPGNNGGDGFAIARHLHNANIAVTIVITAKAENYHGDALLNLRIIQKMNLPLLSELPNDPPDLLIDAIFGTGLTRAADGAIAMLIEKINALPCLRLAIDIPTGLDCDRGEPTGACVRAQQTVTFVAHKIGFKNPIAKTFTGKISVVDIGCPREVIEQVLLSG